jgi:hypothetical protein
MSELIERCEHGGCGYENRAEYCEPDSNMPDGLAQFAKGIMDELIYDAEDVASTDRRASTSSESTHFFRRFEYFDEVKTDAGWTVTETLVAISRESIENPSAESYRVLVGWMVRPQNISLDNELATGGIFTEYTIDLYDGQEIASSVKRMDLEENVTSAATMTDYDYGTLIEELCMVSEKHAIERGYKHKIELDAQY